MQLLIPMKMIAALYVQQEIRRRKVTMMIKISHLYKSSKDRSRKWKEGDLDTDDKLEQKRPPWYWDDLLE